MQRSSAGIAMVLCGFIALASWLTLVPATHAQEIYSVYLPWVPNNEVIGGQGPWQGALSVQNTSDSTCAVTIYITRDNAWIATARLTLLGEQSISIGAGAFAISSPGSPMRFDSYCRIVVSVKLVTPSIPRTPWSDGADIVTGYTALQQVEIAAAHAQETSGWFLPIAQTNSGWNSYITIANLSTSAIGDVSVRFYPRDNALGAAGAVATIDRALHPTETWTIDTREIIGADGWVGYVSVTSNVDSGVIVRRVKPATQMALTNTGIAAANPGSGNVRVLAPLLFNNYNGWNTGINIANPTSQAATVTLKYFEADQQMAREETHIIAANSMEYIYTPGTDAPGGFVGSATIISDTVVVAAVDEVKYSTTEALSYMASGIAQHTAAVPVVFQGDAAHQRNDNSGINVANMDPDNPATVTIRIISRAGEDLLATPLSVTLPAGGNSFVYLPFVTEIPPGTRAAAILSTENPAGFVAVSNDVNYIVPGDGSVVFAATSADGYVLIPEQGP